MPISRRSVLTATLLGFGLTLKGWSALAQVPSPLQVDDTEYLATCTEGRGDACRYGFTAVARYENRTADTVYVSRCQPRDRTPEYGVEVIDDTTKDAAYDPVWACVGHDFPIVIAPRATRVDTLRIDGPNAFDGRMNAPMGTLEGQFRLIYKVGRCWLGRATCRTPLELRRSQPFRVHVARYLLIQEGTITSRYSRDSVPAMFVIDDTTFLRNPCGHGTDFTLARDIWVVHDNGADADTAALKVGQRVSVFITEGTGVFESCPPATDAAKVILR